MHLFYHKPHTLRLYSLRYFYSCCFFFFDRFFWRVLLCLVADIHQIVMLVTLYCTIYEQLPPSRLTVISTRIVKITNKSHLQNRNEQPEYIYISIKAKCKKKNEIFILTFHKMDFVSAVISNRMSKCEALTIQMNSTSALISFDTIAQLTHSSQQDDNIDCIIGGHRRGVHLDLGLCLCRRPTVSTKNTQFLSHLKRAALNFA